MAKLVEMLKALSDETRFRLLRTLLAHDFCVRALARHLGISEAAASQHLKVLREAGLVKGEKRSYWTHYTVERDRLHLISHMIAEIAETVPDDGTFCRRTQAERKANGNRDNCCAQKNADKVGKE